MDLHYKQEVTVGVMVLAGIAIFVGGTMWLKGNSFSRGDNGIRIQFADVGTLKKGSVVKVSGVSLGKVEDVEFESVGKVLVSVSLSPRIVPKIDAAAKLATVGLVADAVINFNPGSSAQALPPGQVIQGVVDQGIMELGAGLAGNAKDALTGISAIANKKLADNLNATLAAMQKMMAVYSATQSGPVGELSTTMKSLQRLSARLDSTMTQAQLARTLRTADTLLSGAAATSAQFTTTTQRLDSLLQKINRGDGTIGKLMTDSLLYGDIRRVSAALEKLIDELRKNPGKITIQIKAF